MNDCSGLYKGPLVSVIIPTFNRGATIRRCLNSIREQTFTDWEAIVVDNFSSDNTEHIVSSLSDSRIKFYRIRNYGCVAVSRNFGVQKSEGDLISFLDSDDWWTPNKLSEILRLRPNTDCIMYHDFFLDSASRPKFFPKRVLKTRQLTNPYFTDLIVHGNALINSGVVMSRSLFNRIGEISTNKSLITAEDYDYWLKASELNVKFTRVPLVLGYYSLGHDNLSTLDASHKATLHLLGKYKKKMKDQGLKLPAWMALLFMRKALKKRQISRAFRYLCYLNFAKFSWALGLRGILWVIAHMLKIKI